MISFGSDPEFMLSRDGEIYSAIGIVQGDIENRITIKGHQFYYDNVMAECAVRPAYSTEKAVESFRECFQIYADMVKPFRLLPQASYDFPESQLTHPAARHVGCSPDTCAYRLTMMDAPKDEIQGSNFRSCGGHIHLGHPILTSDGPEPIIAVYLLDLFLGTASLWLDRDPTSAARRGLYGQAGRYRVKDYGIEYRSLGNFWLQSPDLVRWIHNVCEYTVNCLESGCASDIWSFDEDLLYESENPSDAFNCTLYDVDALREAIDTGNKDLAQNHYAIVRSLLPTAMVADLDRLISSNHDFYRDWSLE